MRYTDGFSIPHSWYTIEDFNHKLYIQRTYGGMGIDERYTDTNYPDDEMTCTYDSARGTIRITATFEFQILSDFRTMSLTLGFDNSFVWVGSNNYETNIDVNDLYSTNELLRNYEYDPNFGTTYESGFIDLLNVQSSYTHCPNLGHYNTVGV